MKTNFNFKLLLTTIDKSIFEIKYFKLKKDALNNFCNKMQNKNTRKIVIINKFNKVIATFIRS